MNKNSIFGLVFFFSWMSFVQGQTAAPDNCAASVMLDVNTGSCNSIEYTFGSAGTSGTDPVPSCWDNPPSNTVWFQFIPDSSSVSISTNFGGPICPETQIALFEGPCGALVELECNDDISAGNTLSRIQANGLTPGNTYTIMVDGEGCNGSFYICVENIVSPGPADPIQDCPTGRFLCSKETIFIPNGPGSSGLIMESPTCFSSGGERSSHWYRFYIETGGSLGFSIVPNSSSDYDFAVFDITNTTVGSGFCDLTDEKACNWSNYTAGDATTGLGCGNFTPPADPPCDPVINVVTGRTYALLVSRFTESSTSGYDLTWSGTSVFGVPPIDFSASTVCSGSPTQFSFLSQGSYTFLWDFGDGNSSTERNPSHVYDGPGTYTVKLYTSSIPGNCPSYLEKTVVVFAPSIDLNPNAITICEGEEVNLSSNITLSPPGAYQTFHENTTEGLIPDNGIPKAWNGSSGASAQKIIAVNDLNPAVWDVEKICFSATHPNVGDIQVYLETPCGDLTAMVLNEGGSGDNFTNTCFSKSAPPGTTLSADSPPFTGTYVPEDNSLFWSTIASCTAPNGDWIIRLGDDTPGNQGKILSWDITFSSENGVKSFSWSPITDLSPSSSLNPTASPSSSTSYTLTVNDYLNCSSTATAGIEVDPRANPGTDNFVFACSQGQEISLFPLLGGTPEMGGTWSDIDNSNALVGDRVTANNLNGVYRFAYRVEGKGACPDEIATVTIEFERPKNPGTDAAITICPQEQIVDLFSQLGGTPETGGTWTTAAPGNVNSGSGDWLVPAGIDAGTYSFSYAFPAGNICPAVQAIVEVEVKPLPTPVTQDICEKDDAYDLENLLVGLDADLQGVWIEQTSSGAISNGRFFNANGLNGLFDFEFQITNFDFCPNSTIACSLEVNQAPELGFPFYTCSGDESTYTATFTITGGAPPYTISNGSITGTNPFEATTNPIPSQMAASISIDDSLGCGPVNIDLYADCNCKTKAGLMLNTQDTLRVCESGIITAQWDSVFVNDGDDNFHFILHDSPYPYIGTIKATSDDPEFDFLGGMELDKVYYISSVAGNRTGPSGIDYNDPCLDVSPGTPVQWRSIPNMNFSLEGVICEGSTAEMQVILTRGTPDFFGILETDGVPDTVYFYQDTTFLNVSPTTTTTYEFTYIEDVAQCSRPLTNGPQTLQVNPSPKGTISIENGPCSADPTHQVKFELEGRGTNFDVFISGGADAFSFNNISSGTVVTINPSTFPVQFTLDSIIDLAGNSCPQILQGQADFYFTPELNVSMGNLFCAGNTIPIQFDPNSTNGFQIDLTYPPGVSKTLNGDSNQTFSDSFGPLMGGNYIVEILQITDTVSGCVNSLDYSLPFTVNPSPFSDFTGDVEVCDSLGLEVELGLTNSSGVPPYTAYFSSSFQGGFSLVYYQDTTIIVNPVVNGGVRTANHYILDSIADGGNGCIGRWNDTVTVMVKPVPTGTLALDRTSICAGDSVRLILSGTGHGSLLADLGGIQGSDTVFRGNYFLDYLSVVDFYHQPDSNINYQIFSFSDQTNPVCQAKILNQPQPVEVFQIADIALNIMGNDIYCQSDSIYLETTNRNPGGYLFQLSTSSTILYNGNSGAQQTHSFAISAEDLGPGIHAIYLESIVANDGLNCPGISTDTLSITVNATPQIDLEIENGSRICEGETVTVNFIHKAGQLPLDIQMNTGQGIQSFVLNSDTLPWTYTPNLGDTLSVISISDRTVNRCSGPVPPRIPVEIKPLPKGVLASSIPFCEESGVRIPIELSGEGNVQLYFSTDSDSTFQQTRMAGNVEIFFLPNVSGNIVLTIDSIRDSGTPSCLLAPTGESALLEVHPTPEVAIEKIRWDGCPPLMVEFVNQTPLEYRNGGSSEWTIEDFGAVQDVDTLRVLLETPGEFDLTLQQTSAVGCVGRLHLTDAIDVYSLPRLNFTFSPLEPDVLNPLVDFWNTSENTQNFLWKFDSLGVSTDENPFFEFPIEPNDYTICLSGSNREGCVGEVCKVLRINGRVFAYIPNAFTPDNNGHNEVFRPVVNGYREDIAGYDLEIFDRWGQSIFKTQDPELGWDGTFSNGKKCPVGVYLFRLILKSKYSSQVYEYSGPLDLIR